MFRYQFLRFPEGKCRAFTMSYDDGCAQDKRLSDAILPYGLKCTFNLNALSLGRPYEHSVADIEKYIYGRGHEVAVHGALHRATGRLRPIEILDEVLECRRDLEARLGRIIRGMAYPDSGIRSLAPTTTYADVKRALTDCGIVYARTLGEDNRRYDLPADFHAWMPTAHHTNPELLSMLDEFLAFDYEKMYISSRRERLFYVWGHAFEFDGNNDWSLLDEMGKRISASSDVWCATNMEIYEYVTAYASLIFSADNGKVYNPTLKTVWFERDGVMYSVAPGETLDGLLN